MAEVENRLQLKLAGGRSTEDDNALAALDAEEIDGYYRLLWRRGAHAGPNGARRRSDFRLGFTDQQVDSMIEQFDQGKGVLSLDDFRTLVRLLSR